MTTAPLETDLDRERRHAGHRTVIEAELYHDRITAQYGPDHDETRYAAGLLADARAAHECAACTPPQTCDSQTSQETTQPGAEQSWLTPAEFLAQGQAFHDRVMAIYTVLTTRRTIQVATRKYRARNRRR